MIGTAKFNSELPLLETTQLLFREFTYSHRNPLANLTLGTPNKKTNSMALSPLANYTD
jgi:hypothetical protein